MTAPKDRHLQVSHSVWREWVNRRQDEPWIDENYLFNTLLPKAFASFESKEEMLPLWEVHGKKDGISPKDLVDSLSSGSGREKRRKIQSLMRAALDHGYIDLDRHMRVRLTERGKAKLDGRDYD